VLSARRRDDPIREFDDLTEIGSGTFARVYRAIDRQTGQPVALKILRVRSSRSFDIEAFEHEARTLGPVSGHPHIVTLYRAFVSTRGEPVLVMELCRSSMASALAEQGPLAPRAAVSAAVKLAGALETAHRSDIIHRDIKPQNILITTYGEPALADFGVAALRSGGTPSSPSSAMTLFHAAPEVVLGAEGDVRSDVYSLASTLYELIEGRPPFYVTALEDPREVQTRVLTRPAPRLSGIDIPVRLADLMRRSLSKEPTDRPATALELAQLLRLIEEGEAWAITPCPVAGLTELPPLPVAPAGRSDPERAARSTSIPPLGLGHRSFREVGPRDVAARASAVEAPPPAQPAGTTPRVVEQEIDQEVDQEDVPEVEQPDVPEDVPASSRTDQALLPEPAPTASTTPQAGSEQADGGSPTAQAAPTGLWNDTPSSAGMDILSRLRDSAGLRDDSRAEADVIDPASSSRAVDVTADEGRADGAESGPGAAAPPAATEGEISSEPEWGFPAVPLDGTVTRARSRPASSEAAPERRRGLLGRLRGD
jgi:serine/threonine protein kinase